MKAEVIEFQMEFTTLDKLMYDTDRRRFDICVLMLRASMLQTRHAKLKRQLKPTRKGTKFNFVPIQSLDEFTEEANRIVEEAKKIKEKRKEGKT